MRASALALFLVRRLGAALVAALLSTLAVFLLLRAVPGDIVGQMLGQASNDPTAVICLLWHQS